MENKIQKIKLSQNREIEEFEEIYLNPEIYFQQKYMVLHNVF